LKETPVKADILFTDNPKVSLYMRFGDCVPILFHDPVKKIIGIAHAGWMGTVRGVAKAAVEGMQSHYGSKAENIIAGIGPSIGVDHYEVGTDVISQFQEKYNQDADQFLQERLMDSECYPIKKRWRGTNSSFGAMHCLSFGRLVLTPRRKRQNG